MSVNVLYAGNEKLWPVYEVALAQALAEHGLDATLSCDLPPAQVDYIVYAPNGKVQDFAPFTGAKAVLGLWAGVEKVVGNPTLTQPYTRMVDDGLTEGMTEWVTGQVLRHHLGLDRYIHRTDPIWHQPAPPLARDRTVAVLGLGALGSAAAQALRALNFKVCGWSRRPKDIAGIDCHSGDEGLRTVLAQAEIVVLLLPKTQATENILNAERLGWLPKGAVIINPGRGPLIDDQALLAALDSGQVAHATLDVFRVEPLPDDHPFWTHPNVTVTPHIAADTRPSSAARVVAENIRRSEAGEPLLHLVDRDAGY
ncbi:glyoxylate/hydroxypyruvate reductase A [Aliiroseovarius zhejiangensis]|uniref:Glyoxylate/hydroxypyruvate reductase A n=1 Tax=Aliiroseovarius zhejiangensis TaxID=1632025 RepID=A0ABQ3J0J0_9RHOB|nr:glyoxylate/hydroxypyruvate reductase A [Aliiroseovarius zhejiangensis]GHE99575.1 glyoxylate/hydroxypyruvate reductase A [Aliiroseovarius zhejiangensis]